MSRLDELLARNLGTSKSAVARLVEEGRVSTTGGEAIADRKMKIPTTTPLSNAAAPAVVVVDGQPITLFESALILLHKPTGVVTAMRDAVHPTAFSLLAEAPLAGCLRPVGRLDLDTSGLLLWTTEGALIQRLTHPKRRVPRTYHAALAGPFRPLPAAEPLTLEDGHRPEVIALDEIPRAAAHPALVVPEGSAVLAAITVVGGAYHEVRRIFAALGSHVLGLCRVRFGAYELPAELPPGRWQALALPADPS